MDPTFRFLHASDLHLEKVAGGLAEVPEHLRRPLADAAYRAAERVFDAAIKHRVDFVVLAGDVIDPPAAGARGIVFLNEQFAKLDTAGIRVYWAGSLQDDFERWVDHWQISDNVHRFAIDRVERLTHYRAGEPLVEIIGVSRLPDSHIPWDELHANSELFTIFATHAEVEADRLARRTIGYWALGGEHSRRTLLGGTVTAHFPGTHQGRKLQEIGPHGCTLVQVDETRRVRTTFIPTDTIRYCDERIVIDDTTLAKSLLLSFEERMAELLIDPFGPDLLVHWRVSGNEHVTRELRAGKSAELLAQLRANHGAKHPGAWSTAIDGGAAVVPVERFDEQTLLGEFLRSTQHYREHANESLRLEPYLSERHLAGGPASLAELHEPAVREHTLAEAAALGYELLSPAEPRS
jgi:DNA repair exonuclease SbcCD nuclease subunit